MLSAEGWFAKKIDTEKMEKWRTVLSKILGPMEIITLLCALILVGTNNKLFSLFVFLLACLTLAGKFAEKIFSKEISQRENEAVMTVLKEEIRKIKFKELDDVILKSLLRNAEIEAQYNEEEGTVDITFEFIDDLNKKYTVTRIFREENVIPRIEIL